MQPMDNVMTGRVSAHGVLRSAVAEVVADQSWLPPGQARTGSRFWCARSVATQLSRRRDEPDGSVVATQLSTEWM